MSRKLSTLIVNGSPTGLERVVTDSNQRDRQLLIKAIKLELDGSTRRSNKSELVEFLKIEKSKYNLENSYVLNRAYQCSPLLGKTRRVSEVFRINLSSIALIVVACKGVRSPRG